MKQPLSPTKLLERDIQRQVKDFLKWRQWRIVRQQVAMATSGTSTFSTGEKGMADILAIYYFRDAMPGLTLTLWIETKRPGKQLRPDQVAWRDKELVRNAVVWKVDRIDHFIHDYEKTFGWIHVDDRVKGQKTLTFDELTKSPKELVSSR